MFGSRRRRRRLLKQVRENIRPMNPEAANLPDDQLERIATKFGSLEQMVRLTDPSTKAFIAFAADLQKVKTKTSVSREDVRAAADDVRRLVEEPTPSPQTHEESGELLKLRGGPMDGWLVRDGAPALQPGWPGGKGAYTRSQPSDVGDDGYEIATWEPA